MALPQWACDCLHAGTLSGYVWCRDILALNIQLLVPPLGLFSFCHLGFLASRVPNISLLFRKPSLSLTSRPNPDCVTFHTASQIEICMFELFLFSLSVFAACTRDFGRATAPAQVYSKPRLLCPSMEQWPLLPRCSALNTMLSDVLSAFYSFHK